MGSSGAAMRTSICGPWGRHADLYLGIAEHGVSTGSGSGYGGFHLVSKLASYGELESARRHSDGAGAKPALA